MTQLTNFFAHVLRSRSALCRLHHLHGRPDQGGHFGHVARHDEGGGCVGGHLAVGIHGFFCDLELYGLLSPWLADGRSHARAQHFLGGPPGELLAYVGSASYIEVAVRDGSAAGEDATRRPSKRMFSRFEARRRIREAKK